MFKTLLMLKHTISMVLLKLLTIEVDELEVVVLITEEAKEDED